MKATTMRILDLNEHNLMFGVKIIRIPGRKDVYLGTKNGLFCVATKAEAQAKADEINRTLDAEPDCLDRVRNDKSIKCVIF